jgi:hypothetical protein
LRGVDREQRARGIVHEDQVGVGVGDREPVLHRFLARIATLGEAHVAECLQGCLDRQQMGGPVVAVHDHDQLVAGAQIDGAREPFGGMQHQRFAQQGQVGLRDRTTKP